MNEKRKKLFLTCLFSFLSMMAFCFLNSVERSNSFACLLSFGGSFFFFWNTKTEKNIWTILVSIVLSILLVVGKYPVYLYEYEGTYLLLVMIISVLGSFVFINAFLSSLYSHLEQIQIKSTTFSAKKIFILSFAVIFVSWLVVWMAEYPGNISPDTLNQFTQIFGDRKYSNANPLIHTLIIQLLYSLIGQFTKDPNRNIAIIALVQMVFNSLIYAYSVSYIHSRIKSLPLSIGFILFYSLISYHAVLNISISKDALYASLTILFLVELDKLCLANSKKDNILFVITAVLYCLIRSNGFYSYLLVFVALVILVLRYRTKKLLIVFTVALTLTMLIRSPVYSTFLTSANEKFADDTVERTGYYFKGSFFLCLPFQQVANVVSHERQLSEDETSLIEQYASLEQIKETYNPIFVDVLFELALDNAKDSRAEISDFEYLKLWIKLGLKYPSDYLEAYANLTRYYYYPNRIVNTNYTEICNNDYGFEKEILISEAFNETVEGIYQGIEDLPFVGILFCPGIVSFLLIVTFFYAIKKKNWISFLESLLLMGNLAVLMTCVPLNDEFRYIYPMVTCLPFILYQLLNKERYLLEEKR